MYRLGVNIQDFEIDLFRLNFFLNLTSKPDTNFLPMNPDEQAKIDELPNFSL
jgi:hypothetical protein